MAWTQTGNLKGPQGRPGKDGDPGKDGKGVEIAGQVPTYLELPVNLTTADSGKAYIVDEDGLLYVWTGSAFPSDGSGVRFVGPQGKPGDDGEPGPPGNPGPRGSMWFTGEGTPGTVPGSQAGDKYLDTVSGTVYDLV